MKEIDEETQKQLSRLIVLQTYFHEIQRLIDLFESAISTNYSCFEPLEKYLPPSKPEEPQSKIANLLAFGLLTIIFFSYFLNNKNILSL